LYLNKNRFRNLRPLGPVERIERDRPVPSRIEESPSQTKSSSPKVKVGTWRHWRAITLRVSKLQRRQVVFFLGYVLYAVSLLALFLFFTFPADKLQARLVTLLEGSLASQIEVKETRWLYPIGVAWKGKKEEQC